MPLRIFNTMSRKVEEVVARDPSRVTFYSCGPTVYDDAHIGNFRSFLAADVLRRWIEHPWCELRTADGGVHEGPRKVIHVMNITDVGHMTDDAEGGEHGEDRMAVAGRRLLEAKKSGTLPPGVDVDASSPYAIARFYESRFKDDARKLGLKLVIEADADPTLTPRATESIAGMIQVVERLVRTGFAYVVGEPGSRVVYFSVERFPAYGRLSGNTLDALREGEGGRVDARNQASKRHPADFLLWKEDPRHAMRWESPWGAGYPGWHIECTAMSVNATRGGRVDLRTLTAADAEPLVDLHSGGEDNIFPHHECEIAQTCAAFNPDAGRPGFLGTFSRVWFHPRFMLVGGEKMSKSKGNFFTPKELFAKGVEAGALRLELIRTHHRSNANFTEQGLRDGQRMIDRWRRVASGGGAGGTEEARRACREEFTRALNDDLNVAGAVAAVNTWVGAVESPGPADAALMRAMDEVLGVVALEGAKAASTELGVFVGVEPSAAVSAKLEERRAARASKDFKRSDAIRDELAGMGYSIKDVAGGKVEVRRA